MQLCGNYDLQLSGRIEIESQRTNPLEEETLDTKYDVKP